MMGRERERWGGGVKERWAERKKEERTFSSACEPARRASIVVLLTRVGDVSWKSIEDEEKEGRAKEIIRTRCGDGMRTVSKMRPRRLLFFLFVSRSCPSFVGCLFLPFSIQPTRKETLT